MNRLMKGDFWLLLKVVTTYIGAVIGAGFASGQEIMQFFVLHGSSGLRGVFLATVLFAYLGGLIMFLSVKSRSTSYGPLLRYLLGSRAGPWMDVLNLFMLLGGLSVMMAGSAALFHEQFALPARAGALVMGLLTALVILGGLEGVLTANILLVPLKFLAVAFISLAVLWQTGGFPGDIPAPQSGGGVAGHWAPAGLLYVSYNMVVPLAVLSSLGRTVPLKVGVLGGALGGLLLGLAVSLVALAGLAHLPEAAHCQIPLLYLAGQMGEGVRWVLAFLIWLAVLTTSIADAHGIASRLAPEGGSRYRFYGIGACVLALPLSAFSFAGLVGFLYPLFGFAGLALLGSLLLVPPVKGHQKF